ncbi:ABC transporter permease [Gulosibacter faecalis]|jgi:peptide/nickel transport system permease protein|uniref:ABC transporter permease n=1 Tax=Gulosibacter faecalis TaxID=272240 RepID=A0ABW5UTS6_9MICO|nr:ABC transporter permease [Gulosibacter faecalis]
MTGMLRRPGVLLASAFLLAVAVAAAWPTLLTPLDPAVVDAQVQLTPPNAAHPFGTDELGRDVFARVVWGAELTLKAAVIAIAIGVGAGFVIGAVAGYVGGRVDAVLMRLVDVGLALPSLLLALLIITAIGYGTVPVAIAVGIGFIPTFARTTRARIREVRGTPYVEAARIAGVGSTGVLVRHVLPNSVGPVAVLAVLDVGTAIIWVAALSFLGFGAQPPLADWGSLISDGRSLLVSAPWVPLLPGLVVALTVFSLNHISKSIEEAGA